MWIESTICCELTWCNGIKLFKQGKWKGKVRFYLEEAIKITERFNYILKKNGYEPVSVENLFYRKSYK